MKPCPPPELSRLSPWQRLCRIARRLLPRMSAGARHLRPAPGGASAGEPVIGCGWFDSSHDLQRGLWVQEHASPDAVAQELPLAGWLELHLARPATAG